MITYLRRHNPAVSFYYDGKGLAAVQEPHNYAKGKLTKVTSSVSESQYQLFDNLGRMTQMAQITDGHTYTSKYTYNFSGALVEEEYPSGHISKSDFEAYSGLLDMGDAGSDSEDCGTRREKHRKSRKLGKLGTLVLSLTCVISRLFTRAS